MMRPVPMQGPTAPDAKPNPSPSPKAPEDQPIPSSAPSPEEDLFQALFQGLRPALMPEAMARVLLDHMPEDPEGDWGLEHKLYWTAVAEHLGREGIQTLKALTRFMSQVDAF